MLSHNQIKYINSLKIKKYRQQHKAFFVEGEKGVAELFQSTFHIVKVFALREWIDANYSLLENRNTEIQEITPDELKKISDLISPNLVIAIAEIPGQELPDSNGFKGMMLALDGIRDPGNMGTIIRTADWFGIKRIICSTDSVDIFNPKVVQATMGSFSRIEVFYVDLQHFFSSLPSTIPVFGALLEGPDLSEKSFRKEGIILIGSESHGISKNLVPFVNEPVYIPHFMANTSSGAAESLNASIANGIICYEICKQLYKNNF
jgi:TrmH family RNA methyltransferase